MMLLFSIYGLAQQEPDSKIVTDSTFSNYENQDAIGGPKTIGGQIAMDDEKRASYFRIPIRVFKPYFDWKSKVKENTGIQFSINYTSVFFKSSEVIDEEVNDKNSGSGIFDLQLGWTFLNRNKGTDHGTLFAKINSRHSYSNSTPPMLIGSLARLYGLWLLGIGNG